MKSPSSIAIITNDRNKNNGSKELGAESFEKAIISLQQTSYCNARKPSYIQALETTKKKKKKSPRFTLKY